MGGGGAPGSRTGACGWGFVSGGKGTGAGFGFSGSDGSCGVTGGISGFSTFFKDSAPLFYLVVYGRPMLKFWPRLRSTFMFGRFGCGCGLSSPWTIASFVMILGSVS